MDPSEKCQNLCEFSLLRRKYINWPEFEAPFLMLPVTFEVLDRREPFICADIEVIMPVVPKIKPKLNKRTNTKVFFSMLCRI